MRSPPSSPPACEYKKMMHSSITDCNTVVLLSLISAGASVWFSEAPEAQHPARWTTGGGEIYAERVLCVCLNVCWFSYCECVQHFCVGILVRVLSWINVSTVPCLPPQSYPTSSPLGFGVRACLCDGLFYLTWRGTPFNTTLAWWCFKLSETEWCPTASQSLKQLQPSWIYWL